LGVKFINPFLSIIQNAEGKNKIIVKQDRSAQ